MGLVLITAAAAHAQDTTTKLSPLSLDSVLSTLLYSVLGILLAIGGFKLFDHVIPFDMEREICEKNNLAVAVLAAAMVLGICLIVGLVVLS